jgi:hypothetical protein
MLSRILDSAPRLAVRRSRAVITATVVALLAFSCNGGSDPAPGDANAAGGSDTTPSAAPATAGAVQFVEFAYASTYTALGVYRLTKAQPGDLMLIYLTNLSDFQMPAGWTQIGNTIVLNDWNTYPVKAFYRVRQAGDPTTYTIAQSTGFLSVYRNVDPQAPYDSFVHAMSQSQTPAVGSLIAPVAGSGAVYFFIGLYHSDILAPAGYQELYGCQHYAGSSHDTGTGQKLNLAAGETASGNIFIAAMDCKSPGTAPYKEAVFHIMLKPLGEVPQEFQPTGLRIAE